jgi:hypothetical protein
VSNAEKTFDRQLSSLALAGPFFILIVLFIILIKTSLNYTYLPFAALIGIPLCYKWNMRGLAGALSFLILLSLYKYPDITSKERLLYLGLTISLAITLYTIALVFQEIEAFLNRSRQEIDKLNNHIQSHETDLKTNQEEWSTQHHTLESQKTALEERLTEREAHLQLHEKTIAVIRNDLVEMSKKQEVLTTELFVKRNEVRDLHVNLEEARQEIEQLLFTQDSDTNLLEIHNLAEKLALKEKSISDLHLQLQESSEKISSTTKQLEACFQELTVEQEINFDNKTLSEQALKEHMLQQSLLQETQDFFATQTREKELLETTLQKLQQESELLREQDAQHLNLIKTHETLIDFLKNTLKEQEHRFQHEKENFHKTHSQSIEREQAMLQQVRELNAQWTLAQHQLEEWQRKVSDHDALNESFSHSQDKLFVLTEEKESLLQQLKELSTGQTTSLANWEEAHFEWRRNEGLYLQLRNQFIEKSTTLDETRRELFNTQEEVLRLQLEQKEAFLYNRSPIDQEIERHLIRMEQEYVAISQEYRQEVDALHQLIETLLK